MSSDSGAFPNAKLIRCSWSSCSETPPVRAASSKRRSSGRTVSDDWNCLRAGMETSSHVQYPSTQWISSPRSRLHVFADANAGTARQLEREHGFDRAVAELATRLPAAPPRFARRHASSPNTNANPPPRCPSAGAVVHPQLPTGCEGGDVDEPAGAADDAPLAVDDDAGCASISALVLVVADTRRSLQPPFGPGSRA